jgi:hypothetical protein
MATSNYSPGLEIAVAGVPPNRTDGVHRDGEDLRRSVRWADYRQGIEGLLSRDDRPAQELRLGKGRQA